MNSTFLEKKNEYACQISNPILVILKKEKKKKNLPRIFSSLSPYDGLMSINTIW